VGPCRWSAWKLGYLGPTEHLFCSPRPSAWPMAKPVLSPAETAALDRYLSHEPCLIGAHTPEERIRRLCAHIQWLRESSPSFQALQKAKGDGQSSSLPLGTGEGCSLKDRTGDLNLRPAAFQRVGDILRFAFRRAVRLDQVMTHGDDR